MFSRLSGLANTVLHELSGEGDDGDPGASDTGQSLSPVQGNMEDAPEDVLERLAQTEQLVVHLKTLIREKDCQLQQKDATLKEDRDLADVKLAKLKLQAKAKVASLNKQIEELKKSAPAPPAVGDLQTVTAVEGSQETMLRIAAEGSQELSNGQSVSEQQGAELEGLKLRLSEQSETVGGLQETLCCLKEQLVLAKELENKQAEQLYSLQEVISVKDSRIHELQHQHEEELREVTARLNTRLQEQAQQHETTLRHLAESTDVDLQQTLKTLQRKQEEQEEALLGRTRVVEMLQQELQNADQQKQVLSQRFREMEAELNSLKAMLDSVKQVSNVKIEQLEVEVTNKESLLCSLQGELHSLTLELNQVREAQVELVLLGSSKDQIHKEELQSLTEALKEAKTAHEEVQLLGQVNEPSQTNEEVQTLRVALEQARGACEEMKLLQSTKDETHAVEFLSLREALEQARKAQEEMGLLLSSKEEMHAAELQSLTEALEQAKNVQDELEMEKRILEEKQKDGTEAPTKSSEQSGTAHIVQLIESATGAESNEDGEEGNAVISQLLTRRQELCAACDALEVRKEKLVQEVDQQTQQCDDLNRKIQNLQATLISSVEHQETSPVPMLGSDDAIQDHIDEMIKEGKTAGSTEKHYDILLTKTVDLRSKELSILMLDLKDAQEDVSRMKEELPGMEQMLTMTGTPGSQTLGGTTVAECVVEQAADHLRIEEKCEPGSMFRTETLQDSQIVLKGQDSSLQCEESISSVEYVESPEHIWHQEMQTSRSILHLESLMYTSCESGESLEVITETPITGPSFSKSTEQDWQRLQMEILHLQKHEENYKRELEERDAQINRLNQLLKEHKKIEDNDNTVHVVMEDKQESPKVVGITDQLRLLEWNLADAEKERLSDYQSNTMQHSLLGEQINSLENESKSKDLKMESLQKDLDQVQLQLFEQVTHVKLLGAQLQAKTEEVVICEARLQESQTKVEELSRHISLKEVKAAETEQLLSQSTKDIESLRTALADKDLQVAEISHSMSEKMVLLNEEKFSHLNELKALKKHLGSLGDRQKAKDQPMKNEVEEKDYFFKTPELVELEKVVATMQREKEVQEFQLAIMSEEKQQLQGERDVLQGQLQIINRGQPEVEQALKTDALQGQVEPVAQEQLTDQIMFLEKEVKELELQLKTSRGEQLHESEIKETLQVELYEIKAQLETLRKEQLLQQREMDRILQEKEQFQVAFETLKNEYSPLHDEQLATLHCENRDLEQLETLRHEALELQAKVAELQEEKERLQGQLETFRNENCQQSEVLEAVQSENQKLLNHIETLRHEHIVEGKAMEELSEQCELHEQLETVKNSLPQDGLMGTLQHENTELREQLDILIKEGHQRDENITIAKEVKEEAPHPLETTENEQPQQRLHLRVNEDLQVQLEEEKKENEHMKKKLQAALTNRKELMQKIDRLEQEVVLFSGQSKREELIKVETGGTNQDCKLNVEEGELAEFRKMEISLNQQLSEKELALENAKKDLAENASNEEKLQALIKELTLDLQDKNNLIESMKVEVLENQSIIQKLTEITKSSTSTDTVSIIGSSAIFSDAAQEVTISLLESKISSLEQEKEQLQKKVQETLVSRKNTIKKAQEKDRHHREQLKQQKEEYNLLQERFDEQNQHHVSIQEQLRKLQKELEEQKHSQSHADAAAILPISSEQAEPAQMSLQDSLWGQEWVEFTNSEVEDTLKRTDVFQCAALPVDQYRIQIEQVKAQKADLEMQVGRLEEEISKKLGEEQQLQEQMVLLMSNLESVKIDHSEALDTIERLQLELENSRAELVTLEEMKKLQPQIVEMERLLSLQNEEKVNLCLQLREKEEALDCLQNTLVEKEDLMKALHIQLKNEAQDHEEKSKRLQTEVLEVQQKQEEEAEETKSKQVIHRKLQAALISRKEALKESKSLKGELASARNTIVELSNKLEVLRNDISILVAEKEELLQDSARLQEERDKLISEVEKAILENQNLSSSCESLKLAFEGVTHEKAGLEKEFVASRDSLAMQSSEWQEKHKELQKDYETLLQSYENVSNETERIRRVMETVRQEKQEIFNKMKTAEAQKKEVDKQLEEAEHEMDGMKEKMRKFAKSKQQKILELEDENEKLRAELNPSSSEKKQPEDASLREIDNLKEERERLQLESAALVSQLKALTAENISLSEEANYLRHQLQTIEATGSASAKTEQKTQEGLVQENVIAQAAAALSAAASFQEPVKEIVSQDTSAESSGPFHTQEQLKTNEGSSHDEINKYIQQISHLQQQVSELEEVKSIMQEKLSHLNADLQAVTEERQGFQNLLTANCNEAKALQKTIAELEAKNFEYSEELTKVRQLKDMFEVEKDDLEERLMNQLAELNGSIGNYQQDATDFQTKNHNLESELHGFQIRISQLEEEKRQLEREKREAESQMQKEYTEKLKSAHTSEKGRKTHAKELQELLREKQLEVKHLQKDCISYQEKISALERIVKALEFVQNESLKEQAAAKENFAKVFEERKKAQADMTSLKVLLDDTQSETARVLADSLKLKEELQSTKDSIVSQLRNKDEELERRMQQERDKYLKESKNMQEKLDALQREKDHMEGTLLDLQTFLDKKNQDTKELQGSLNENLAKLAAFSRSMSSLQNDRDRVIDESKKWEKKFTSAIQKKETEIQAKEKACQVLKDQAKQMSILVEELQIKVSRLEHDMQDWESKLQTKEANHQTQVKTLQLEKKELVSQLEDSQKLHRDGQDELSKLDEEGKTLREQLTELENAFRKCESTKAELEVVVKEMESEMQNSKFSCEQLQADLQASKDLTNRLHGEIEVKDQSIIGLLAAKEEAVLTATTELFQQHSNEVKELEDQIRVEAEEKGNLEAERKKLEDNLTALKAKLKTTKEQGKEHKARLDSFTKSMNSLQDDRDRVLEEYKQLEERHLAAILAKDQLIQEAAAENNELKEEIRGLYSGMDDLNSENAKLAAQLVRYREDLNQVITLKDSQQKQLLKAQLEQIHSLGDEKITLERQLQDSVTTIEGLKQTVTDLQEERQRVASEVETLTLCVSQLNNELTSLKGNGPLFELEVELQKKEKEVEGLSSELLALRDNITKLEESRLRIQSEADTKVTQMEEKHEKELKSLQHDAGIMRNETETAEVRVAELAKDLMEMEQRLLTVLDENTDLKAQVLAFGKSMSSLQDSRDQAVGRLEDLEKKCSSELAIQEALVVEHEKELTQLRDEQGLLMMERDSLTTQLTSLKSSTFEQDLLSQVEQLNQTLVSKEEEVSRLSSELDSYSTQLKSFSKAMGSLQDERDRLLRELDKQRKVEDDKQQSSATATPAEVQSMKNALSSLQNDRDRLLKELKNLQQQYLRIGEETADITKLKAQLEESQQQLEVQLSLQEQLRKESASQQQELLALREERLICESQNESLKKQYVVALAEKDQQLSDLQRLLQEPRLQSPKAKITDEQYQRQASPEMGNGKIQEEETVQLQSQLSDSLKQLHQKELRIQQLNSKLSQIFEEKKSLSIQLRGSSQNVRESQQRYNEVLKHCAVLEGQLQELQLQLKESGEPMTDAAPGAPQEKNELKGEALSLEMKELMQRLSETQQQQISSDQELQRLEELLSQERDQRLAAEEALFTSEDQVRKLESTHWAPVQDHSYDVSSTHEHSLLIEPLESTFSKTRSNSRVKRLMQYLFYSRTRTPLLVTAYLLTVHILLVLCFIGRL
ncbi:golgin subfamily B member 1 [Ambystoma mexicanum]|uniref:golgin subfamily B member 1 n=1 Tax=Ambystoma mexicanum TaxID=8296 RepID=UPI0037E80C5A